MENNLLDRLARPRLRYRFLMENERGEIMAGAKEDDRLPREVKSGKILIFRYIIIGRRQDGFTLR